MSLGIRLRRRIRTSSSGGNTFSWIVTTNAFETKRLNGSVSISSAHTIVRATTNTTSSYVSIFGPRSWFTESSMARGWKPKSVSSSSRVRPLGSTMSTHVTAYFSTSSRARPTVTSCSSRTSVGVYAITSTRGIGARSRPTYFKTLGSAPFAGAGEGKSISGPRVRAPRWVVEGRSPPNREGAEGEPEPIVPARHPGDRPRGADARHPRRGPPGREHAAPQARARGGVRVLHPRREGGGDLRPREEARRTERGGLLPVGIEARDPEHGEGEAAGPLDPRPAVRH